MAVGSGIELRAMTEEDLGAVIKAEEVCFSDPWPEDSFRQELERDGAHLRALTAGEDLAGYLVAWFASDEVHLANIAVLPAFRRRGFAAVLLDDLIESAYKRGSAYIVLEVRVTNEEAIRLYERYHFKPVAIRKNYYPREKEDALIMILRLGSEGEVDGGAI